MRFALLRSLIALVAAGMLVFAPASERVSEATQGAGRAELSTLVLMPTVDSARHVDSGIQGAHHAGQAVSLGSPLVALSYTLALLFVLPPPPARPASRVRSNHRSDRAPPVVA
jgi:hypothetical protein